MYFTCEKDMNLGDPEAECYGLNSCPHPHSSYVEALTLSVTLFGDGVTKEIIKGK